MLQRLLIAAALLVAPPALAQPPAPERMDEVVSAAAEDGTFTGAVLVAKGDTVLLDKGYGEADIAWGIPNSPDTRFRIGSLTKQFTAVGILLLQERGQIDLDRPLREYWTRTPASYGDMTARHLLRHRSGIANYTADTAMRGRMGRPATTDEIITWFIARPLEFEPGTQMAYSNSNYAILTRLIEQITGLSYAEFMQANLFGPLGLENTGVDGGGQVIARQARGYAAGSPRTYANLIDPSVASGAGAIYSTTGDLLRWERALFGGEVLDNASMAQFLDADAEQPYALGVVVEDSEDGRTIWHNGAIDGFNSWMGHDPQADITVAVLANMEGRAGDRLGPQLMSLARGKPLDAPGERAEIQLDPVQLAEYEGSYALAPTFKIRMFLEGGRLMTQATGQPAFPVFAESRDRFFLKVVDAQLRFNRNADGRIVSLTLLQGGRETTGLRE